MAFKINYSDLVRCIKAFGHDDDTAKIVADYLDECIDFDFDLSFYLWNTLLFNVETFETKSECLEWIDENLTVGAEDCTIYECGNNIGVYLEY